MDFKNKEDVKFRTLCIRVKQTTQVTTIPEMGWASLYYYYS